MAGVPCDELEAPNAEGQGRSPSGPERRVIDTPSKWEGWYGRPHEDHGGIADAPLDEARRVAAAA